jgi:hypothetical protein
MKKLLITIAAVLAGLAVARMVPLPAALMPEAFEIPVIGKFLNMEDLKSALTLLAVLYLAHKMFASVASPV